ncbi:MAG: hypothetical protein MHM6MM_002720 [Cercozoa sp. M6MM]
MSETDTQNVSRDDSAFQVRTRAPLLVKWHQLIREASADLLQEFVRAPASFGCQFDESDLAAANFFCKDRPSDWFLRSVVEKSFDYSSTNVKDIDSKVLLLMHFSQTDRIPEVAAAFWRVRMRDRAPVDVSENDKQHESDLEIIRKHHAETKRKQVERTQRAELRARRRSSLGSRRSKRSLADDEDADLGDNDDDSASDFDASDDDAFLLRSKSATKRRVRGAKTAKSTKKSTKARFESTASVPEHPKVSELREKLRLNNTDLEERPLAKLGFKKATLIGKESYRNGNSSRHWSKEEEEILHALIRKFPVDFCRIWRVEQFALELFPYRSPRSIKRRLDRMRKDRVPVVLEAEKLAEQLPPSKRVTRRPSATPFELEPPKKKARKSLSSLSARKSRPSAKTTLSKPIDLTQESIPPLQPKSTPVRPAKRRNPPPEKDELSLFLEAALSDPPVLTAAAPSLSNPVARKEDRKRDLFADDCNDEDLKGLPP